MPHVLSRPAIFRALVSLVVAELASLSRRQIAPDVAAAWGPELPIGEEGLGLDSLERVGIASAVSRLFQVHEVGVEDMLLALPTLGEWAELVERVMQEGTTGLTFLTSGSTGEPRPCPHPWAALEDETGFWASELADRQRIVQLVPAHHIYGFLFTIMLPDRLGLPVVDGRALSPGRLRLALEPGSLLVGYPLGLRRLLAELPALPPGVAVLSSTAPLPDAVHRALLAQGAQSVRQIYGSSETAGLATRSNPDAPFTLLPRWRRGAGGDAASVIEVATGREWPLPDRAEWPGEDSLRLLGRKDTAVQVGGINVFPERVAERLATHPAVAACAVRLDASLPEPRLKAFVVPAGTSDVRTLSDELDRWCRATFEAPSRPVHFRFGTALPRSPLGKLADWEAAPDF
ncbi:4-coumarate--CoA ligase [Teichococcus aestuarii]|uniref:4-coumarate--CoA ligase n=1 Tax=Teichococcus aestuarii TaxID=568898 RepID=UPI003620EF40